MTNETTLNLWDRQKHETTYAYTAFCIYRNAGAHRTLVKVAKEFYSDRPASNLRQIQEWSSKYTWVKRVEAWDAFQEQEFRKEMEVARREMAERQVAYGRAMQAKGMTRIKDMMPDDLNPDQANRMVDTGVKIERNAMGEPEKVEVNHTGEVAITPLEKTLKEYEKVLTELADKGKST